MMEPRLCHHWSKITDDDDGCWSAIPTRSPYWDIPFHLLITTNKSKPRYTSSNSKAWLCTKQLKTLFFCSMLHHVSFFSTFHYAFISPNSIGITLSFASPQGAHAMSLFVPTSVLTSLLLASSLLTLAMYLWSKILSYNNLVRTESMMGLNTNLRTSLIQKLKLLA